MSISATTLADIVNVAYDGVIDNATGGQDFTDTYGAATTFFGVLSYDSLDPNQLITNDLVVLNASGDVLMNFFSVNSRQVHIVDAFSGVADNIFIDETYSLPGFSALSATVASGIYAEVFLDIYDDSGNLLQNSDQWPTDPLNINEGGYSTNLFISLNTVFSDFEQSVGSLNGHVPVPAPSGILLMLSGLWLMLRAKKQVHA